MYQVLYRKYRPKVFSDVYGQDHVTETLRNEIKNGRISHAYLFTGSRGTGKTTCAKILAKAVNCENSQNGEPCNECEVCRGLENGSIYDVVEIDAASNNGVDNIRDLREEANYTPTRGKYRVYIIDEVHMLSTGAFNALLKTLEEPPAHVIFILATTEVHKLPATILSRCQRFDFKRIQPETMSVRLKQVAGLEGFALEDDAATLIARIADGALRDGLSILDQCAGRSKTLTTALVSEVAGLAGREALYRLSACIAEKNSSAAISEISELYKNSYDMERLCAEMISHFRNFLVVKTVKRSRGLIICTDDEYNNITESAKRFTLEGVIHALDLFQNTLVTIKGGAVARIEMEMAFVRLCEPKLNTDVSSLLDRLSVVERSVKNGVPAVQAPAAAPQAERPSSEERVLPQEQAPKTALPDAIDNPPEPEERLEAQVTQPDDRTEAPPLPQPPAAAETADAMQNLQEFREWGELMEELRKTEITLYSMLVGSKGYIGDDLFVIDSPNATIAEFINKNKYARTIRVALYNITGKKLTLKIRKHNAVLPDTKRDPLDDLIMRAQTKVKVNLED